MGVGLIAGCFSFKPAEDGFEDEKIPFLRQEGATC